MTMSEDVLLGPEAGGEGRDDREHEPERIAERVEDEDVGGAELPDEPGRLANEKATCLQGPVPNRVAPAHSLVPPVSRGRDDLTLGLRFPT